MVLTGSSPCQSDGNLEESVRAKAGRPLRFWTSYKNSSVEGGFAIRAAAYWNEISEPKFYSFGESLGVRFVQ